MSSPRDPESLEFTSRRWTSVDSTSCSSPVNNKSVTSSPLHPAAPTTSAAAAAGTSPAIQHRQLALLRTGSRVSGRQSAGSSSGELPGLVVHPACGSPCYSPTNEHIGGFNRRDASYRKLQTAAYNFLERPRGPKAIAYHMVVFVMVFACLALSVFSTIDQYQEVAEEALIYMEGLVVLWFTVEFFFRLWSSGCRSRYQGVVGRLKFLRRPFCVIDIVTIVASLVVISLGSSGQVFATSALRGLRFFQILRMVRMDRRGGTWKLLGSVVYAHRQELFTTVYIGFLALIFSSFLMYLAEKEANPKMFSNFADALWWGVITLATVGYGDVYPSTWQGKLIASACALMGISFFALPAGILGSGFALKVQQQQRQKHMIRRRQPAATLIQCLWRCCAADGVFRSVATWKVHMPSPSVEEDRRFKYNSSFVHRLPTIRRSGNKAQHSAKAASTALTVSEADREVASNGGVNKKFIPEAYKNSSDEEEEPQSVRYIPLTPQYRMAIRAIRKMKFFVARRKFKEALKPYDVKDVIEQYSAGHVDLLGRVKVLQARLDQILGKQGSKGKDTYDSKHSLASRIVNVERQVGDIETTVQRILELCLERQAGNSSGGTSAGAAGRRASVERSQVPRPSTLSLSTTTPLKPILIQTDRGQQDTDSSTPSVAPASESQPPQPLSSPVKKRVTLQ